MGMWFWLNIPLALLFVCCWAGIPLWHTLKRWNVELEEKNAELAARTAAEAIVVQPVPATVAAHETSSPAYAGAGVPRVR